jgi:hypothetical protein
MPGERGPLLSVPLPTAVGTDTSLRMKEKTGGNRQKSDILAPPGFSLSRQHRQWIRVPLEILALSILRSTDTQREFPNQSADPTGNVR